MRLVASFAALLLALATGAAADEASDSRAARAAFQKGQTEFNLGNYSEAAKQFEETYRIKPVPALLFNIAQCYRFIGNLEKAVQTYRSYLRNAPPNDKNLALAKELLEQVEKALASKQRAEKSPPHGLARGSQPEATPNSPSTAPAADPAASPAASAPVAIAAAQPAPAPSGKPAPAAAPAASTTALPTPAAPAEAGPRVYTWVAGGAAALALAGGGYFGSKSGSTLNDLKTGYHDRATIDSQTAAARSDASKATAMLAGGAALAVAAGVLFALHF